MSRPIKYPPQLTPEQLSHLAHAVTDYQLTHGSILKFNPPTSSHVDSYPYIDIKDDENTLDQTNLIKSTTPLAPFPVAVSLFPTPFPKALFEEATKVLQRLYQKLYRCVASDEEWLRFELEDVVEHDEMVGGLMEILDTLKEQREKRRGEREKRDDYSLEEEKVRMAIWRSDYMIGIVGEPDEEGIGNRDETGNKARKISKRLELKQIEFNTMCCAGGTHANIVSDMHRFLCRMGEYRMSGDEPGVLQINEEAMPKNNTTFQIAQGLSKAHALYGKQGREGVQGTCILFIVQERNFNIADERPIEYELWNSEPPIPNFRLLFGEETLKYTSLDEDRRLLYHPPARPRQMWEISVVYFRGAHDDFEYDEAGLFARLQLENSRSINCPDILTQLSGLKTIQQALTEAGVLERWLQPEEAAMLRKTFGTMHPLSRMKAKGFGSLFARVEASPESYILKPNREGGGHNVFGGDIPKFVDDLSPEEWSSYIMMEKVTTPKFKNVLMSRKGIYGGPSVSELGVFSTCLWRKAPEEQEEDFLIAGESAWSLKTKYASVEEMSVVKGYGCFDSPLLVDSDTYMAIAHNA